MPIQNTTAEALARSLGGERSGRSWMVPGPGHSAKDRSLKLTDTPDGVVWHSFSPSNDNQTVMAYLLAAAGGAVVVRGSVLGPVEENQYELTEIARAEKIWSEARPIEAGSLADRYLRARCLLPPYLHEMRFHPEVVIQNIRRPCIVSRIRHAWAGRLTGVHLTMLTHEAKLDRTTKSPNGRSYVGKVSGGAVWPDLYDDKIIIAEGIETAFSAQAHLGIPAVPATSSSFFTSLYVPHSVRKVIIVADNDDGGHGLEAARKLRARLESEGREVLIFTLSGLKDANDLQTLIRATPVPVQVARKTPPLSDAACYKDGLIVCAAAPLTHPWLHEKKLTTISGSQTSRFLVYFDLCKLVAFAETVCSIQANEMTHEIVVPARCVLATRSFMAERYGISPDVARHFISKLAELGLASVRRPAAPDGSPVTGDGVPDLIELPAMAIPVEITNENGVQKLQISADSQYKFRAGGVGQIFAGGVFDENIAKSIGYEMDAPTAAPGGGGKSSPQLFKGHEEGKTGTRAKHRGGYGRIDQPSGKRTSGACSIDRYFPELAAADPAACGGDAMVGIPGTSPAYEQAARANTEAGCQRNSVRGKHKVQIENIRWSPIRQPHGEGMTMDDRAHDFDAAESAESAAAPFAPRAAPFAPEWPKTGDEAINVGRKLIATRDGMRGTFKAWVEANCPYSYRRAAEWMKLARDAPKPVNELYLACFAPTEFGEPTLTEDEIEVFASIAFEGVPSDAFSGTERFVRADRVIGFIGTAIRNAPDATFGELLQAVRRAKSDVALIEQQLETLASILMAQPDDGLIGSCAVATQSTIETLNTGRKR